MTLTFFNTGDKPASTVWNENYRHVGRCGFSTFYGMDSSGNYAAQPLGSTAQPWLSANIGTISIASDTITAVGTNAPLKLEATGTARVEIGRVLGAWTIDGYTANVGHLAATDLIVTGHCQASNEGTFEVHTGAASTPTTLIQFGYSQGVGHFTFPVRKGDYWMVTNIGSAFTTFYACTIPIGG